MRIVGVIPARYAATRFPGKPLTPLLGEPMLHWVLKGCQESTLVEEWLVATDDSRIAEAAIADGVRAVMTASALPSGTDRVHAAIQGIEATHVINIQGDEPLITGDAIDLLASTLLTSGCPTATLARRLDAAEEASDPNRVKVVMADDGRALYFSRAQVPHPRNAEAAASYGTWLHFGCYAYTREALAAWVAWPPHPLEMAEGLEQLRALAHGVAMAVGRTDIRLLAIDTPEDVAAVEAALRARYG